MIAAGFAAGGAVQALILWFFVLRGRGLAGTEGKGEHPVLRKGEEHAAAFCTALKRLPGVVFSCSSLQLCFLAALGAASLTGEGAITSLYFADRLLELPVGIVGACMGIAALPDLTREAAAEDRKGFMESLGLALHTGLLFAIPAASGLFAISAPLVGLLLGHGEYSDAGLSGTVLCLRALIPALPACIMLRTLVAACHAWGMDRLAILSTAAAAAGAGVTGVALTFVWTGSSFLPASAIGPLCASAALWVQTGILIWGLLVRARSGKHPFTGTFFSLKALAGLIFCGLTAGAAAMGVQMFGVENRLLTLGLAVCGGGGCWLVSVRILLPEDFMRFVVFQMDDWERAVFYPINTDDPEYARQSSRFKGIRGTYQRPVCAISIRPEGRVMEFYSCKTTKAKVSRAVYLPYPKIDKYGAIEICGRCYNAVVYTIAALVLTTFGDAEKSAALNELAKSVLI